MDGSVNELNVFSVKLDRRFFIQEISKEARSLYGISEGVKLSSYDFFETLNRHNVLTSVSKDTFSGIKVKEGCAIDTVSLQGKSTKVIAWSLRPLQKSGFRMVGVDITSCYRADGLSSIYLKHIIDNIPSFVFWKDNDSVFLGCNKIFADSAGLKNPEEIVGKTDFDLPWGEFEAKSYREDDQEIIRSRKPKLNIEETQTANDGNQIVLSTNKIPLTDMNGQIMGVLAIYTDITKQKDLENKLKISVKKSEVANEAKSEFIANMSHDLRTPIAGVLGMLNGLLFAVEDTRSAIGAAKNDNEKLTYLLEDLTKRVSQCAQMAKKSASNLTLLFNDILENVELESGEMKEKARAFNLDQVVQSSLSLLKPVAENKRLLLTAEIEPDTPCHLIGLHHALRRVLLNLISNGLKFTQAGEVSVVVGLVDAEKEKTIKAGDTVTLKIEVKDTGIGIPEDKYEEIFQHFSRLSSSYQGTHKGLGLGLYAVKNYIETMSGTIKVGSNQGKGSCFTILLPLEVEVLGGSESVTSKQAQTQSVKSSQDKDYSGLRILLVEDDSIAATAVRMGLKHMGCDVDWAKSGEEAITQVNENDYGFVFMDIGLPNMSGIDVARKIRMLTDKKKASVPIVALTGHAGGKSRQICLDAGMQTVLSKPADQEELHKALAYFVKK